MVWAVDFLHQSRWLLGLTQPPVKLLQGFFAGVNWPGPYHHHLF